MKSNYKRLGDYIHKVDERNKAYNTNLQGLSMTKEYRPTTSNIVGTDLSAYKVMRKNRFVCDFMSVIRVYKLPVVLHKSEDIAIVSPAYTTFEINDISVLLPDYLMLWFRRSEFDRYAFFKCDSAIRGGFDWDALCDCLLLIPPLPEQQKIVDAYNTIEHRIELKHKINENLEKQASSIYRNLCSLDSTFFNGTVEDLAEKIVCGKTPSTKDNENFDGEIPFITIPDMHDNVFALKTERTLTDKGATCTIPPNSVCVSCIASAGLVCLTEKTSQTNQQINSIVCKKDISPYYVYLKMKQLAEYIKQIGSCGSTTCNLSKSGFSRIEIQIPSHTTQLELDKHLSPLFRQIKCNQKELINLTNMKSLLLCRLSA